MLSESKLLESYNKRDNFRIFSLKEKTKTDNQNRIIDESGDETNEKVAELSHACEAKVNANDISIAHRLPSMKLGERPVDVRLARGAGKLQLLRNRRALSNKKGHENVKVFEGLTAPRGRFFNMLTTDSRVSSAWTREGSIYYVWKEDSWIYSVRGLYQGGCFLKYSSNVMIRVSNQEISSIHRLTHRNQPTLRNLKNLQLCLVSTSVLWMNI